jgi:hypothetical protein
MAHGGRVGTLTNMQTPIPPPLPVQAPMAATAEPNKVPSNTRYRSFAERYVIERASTFRPGHEDEDAWMAAMRAKTAYNMIKEVGRTVKDDT